MKINLLKLNNLPIFDQLQIEEALLRAHDENWFVINIGSPRAIVLGISGKKEQLIDLEKVKDNNVLMLKRFSGGGTVIVDENTVFTSFILRRDVLDFEPFPEPILRWTASFFKEALNLREFDLRENDYIIGDKKVAGNAQYLKKDRWLHHTTFLYDYKKENMDFLLMPGKTPKYRNKRAHSDFLTPLKSFFQSKEAMALAITDYLSNIFTVEEKTVEDALAIRGKSHRKTLKMLRI